MNKQFEGKWEKRWHPLRQEWVIYAGHRNSRPWTTGSAGTAIHEHPAYDPTCYLCPGNKRVHGASNPNYDSIFIFDNDHPVVGMNAPEIAPELASAGAGLYRREKATGIARVVCYDPRHNVTLCEVPTQTVAKVFAAWQGQMREFIANPAIEFVQIFENKGALSGVSNPHPHCQIYATDFVFKTSDVQSRIAAHHRRDTGRNIYADIINLEREQGLRVVAENENAIAFIPFFARYAYEAFVFPKKRHETLVTLTDTEIYDLSDVFQQLIRKYDVNFSISFPYVMGLVQAPVDNNHYPEHHFHLQLVPPLRQPGLIKYLGGPESIGGTFMADTLPEEKAAELISIDLSKYPIYQQCR